MEQGQDLSNEELLARIEQLEGRAGEESESGEDSPEGDVAALKERLVKQNIGLVKSIAKDYTHSGLGFEDLVQAGYIGLLNAAENFDLRKGNKFSTYATHLIKGEIRHFVRDNQPAVHIPQWIRRLNREIDEVQQRVYSETGELPSIGQLAEELNIEEEGVREVLKARESMTYVSIDESRRESDPRPEYIDYEKIRSKHEEDFPIEYKIKIAEAINTLSEVQQQVIKGLFYEDKTQTAVGDEIGTSQRQVSRIKGRLMEEIKGYLDEEMGEELEGEEE